MCGLRRVVLGVFQVSKRHQKEIGCIFYPDFSEGQIPVEKVEIGNATLYCGDCMPILRGMPDNSVDAVITDPPYGAEWDYDIYDDSFENWKCLINKSLPEMVRISRGAVFIPTSKYEGEAWLYSEHPPPGRICWHKGATSVRGPVGFKDWEMIFVYGKSYGPAHDYFFLSPKTPEYCKEHPCPKPEGWGLWFATRWTKAGDTIVDPFMGSGSIGVDVIGHDRKYIGIELSPSYFDLACKRIDAAEGQGRLEL